MFWIIHALAGEFIGEYFNSVILILLISIISHFILDMIPHWDGNFNRKHFNETGQAVVTKFIFGLHVIDFILCLFLIAYLYKDSHDKFMLLGAFGAILPDLVKVGYMTKLRKNKHYMNHLKFHSKIQNDTNWKLGLTIQGIITLFLIIALI